MPADPVRPVAPDEHRVNWPRLRAVAEEEVEALLRKLPAELAGEAARLPVTLERLPHADLIDDGIEPDTLGLFVGNPHADLELSPTPMPPQIILYLENLWTFAEEDEVVFREEIRTTYLHELGHYLGLDEIDLEERGLE